MMDVSESALESRARRAARRVGLIAHKSRWRAGSIDNFGGFMLIDPMGNWVVNGSRFDLSAAGVIDYCTVDE
jgi:hypothetical protein